jgi:hypothetical protein
VKKSDREIMEILEAFDATGCAHSAARLAGVDAKTVRYAVVGITHPMPTQPLCRKAQTKGDQVRCVHPAPRACAASISLNAIANPLSDGVTLARTRVVLRRWPGTMHDRLRRLVNLRYRDGAWV